jgi:hypothetical protein
MNFAARFGSLVTKLIEAYGICSDIEGRLCLSRLEHRHERGFPCRPLDSVVATAETADCSSGKYNNSTQQRDSGLVRVTAMAVRPQAIGA